jgi:hypothetical protein
MKKLSRSDAASILAVAATVVASGFGVIGLTRVLGLSVELLASIGSALVAFALGWMSTSLAKRVRSFSHTKRIFLSYRHELSAEAHQLAKALSEQGFRVWFDHDQLRPGDSILEAISKGISSADALVVLLGEQVSSNIAFEVGLATSKGIRIVPIRIGDAPIPPELSALKYLDVLRDHHIPAREVATAVRGSA